MKKIIRFIIYVLMMMILASCASLEVVKHAEQVFPKPKDDMALVFFYRPAKFKLATANFDIFQNSTLIAKSMNGSYSFIELNPGIYNFNIKASIPTKTEGNETLNIEVKSGQKYYIKTDAVFYQLFGYSVISLINKTELEAKTELELCKYRTFNF